jgi:DNA-binding transcriptional LysR family regulator
MSNILTNLDLNLLKAFVITYKERNLKRAAERLFVTAPAVSVKLNKLKQELGGELFIKVPTGFEPTALADHLYERVEPLLNQLYSDIGSLKGFEPAKLSGRVNIDLGQHFISWFAPKLFSLVKSSAHQASMTFNGFSENTISNLRHGDVDIGIEYARVDIPKDIMELPLKIKPLVMAVRKDHPITSKTARVEELAGYGCAMIELNLDEGGKRWHFIHEAERQCGVKLEPEFTSSSLEAVVETLCHSNMFCPASKHIVEQYSDKLKSIEFVEMLDLVNYPVSLYLHRRNRHSPKHQWLIDQIQLGFSTFNV